MTVYMEDEAGAGWPFDPEETARQVCQAALELENCPYEAAVALVLTDNAGIRELNRQYRGIDQETDVLSFPNVDFREEGVFQIEEDREADYFDPDTGELVLGDIMISVDKVQEQAQKYGHGIRREFAFLVAHSMLHLCGYDHMEAQQAKDMEERQEAILAGLGITRD